MMKKMSFKDIFVPTVSLFLICLLITAVLALTNSVTAEKIAANEEEKKTESMQAVVPDAVSFEPLDGETEDLFVGYDISGEIAGYAISTAENGYGGQVKVMTGISTDGEIIGVDVFYNDDETPGLGKNTSNNSFSDQYKGLSAETDIVVSKDNAAGNAQTVDAVTSATISSRAVTKAVNDACKIYIETVSDMGALPLLGGIDDFTSVFEETQAKEGE